MTVRWRGRHVFDTIYASRYENLIQQAPDGLWWVDPTNGDDNNSGLNPDVAVATTAQAIVLAKADATAKSKTRGKWYIMRMPGTETLTGKISFDLHGLHLIGLPTNPEKPEDVLYYFPSADENAIDVTKPCEIAGVEICAIWTGSQVYDADGCSLRLDGDAGGFAGNFCHIHHCSFPGWGEYGGICLNAGSYSVIEECLFETSLTAGILLLGHTRNVVNNHIRRNRFDGPTYGIYGLALGTHQNIHIYDNDFMGNITNALKGYANFGGRSNFHGNRVGTTKANAMDGNLAAVTGKGIYAAGNHYTDGVDPRS